MQATAGSLEMLVSSYVPGIITNVDAVVLAADVIVEQLW